MMSKFTQEPTVRQMDVIEWLKLRTNDARPFTSADIKAVLSEVEWLRAELAQAREERDLARDKIRRLQVGDGPTFDELRKVGKIGGGAPYLFEELVDIARAPAPPLVFLHIPRTGCHSFNQILKRNYKVRATSYGASFFPPYFPRQFLSLVQPPETEDDRDRPAFFGGHINIENEIFDYMPVRYVALTILRDPVKRIISHYRFKGKIG